MAQGCMYLSEEGTMVTESLKLTEMKFVYKVKIAGMSNHLIMDSPFTEDSEQGLSFQKLVISTCRRIW